MGKTMPNITIVLQEYILILAMIQVGWARVSSGVMPHNGVKLQIIL